MIYFKLNLFLTKERNMALKLTQTQVSELYVSIFNRASEGEGNTNWQNQNLSMAETATLMLDTGAAKAYFGSSMDTNQAFIEHIYLNTLNKTATDDPSGIANWVNQLDSGAMTKGEVVAAMIEAINTYAPGGENYDETDTKTVEAYNQFNNRTIVSNHMADTIEKPPADYAVSTRFHTSGNEGLVVNHDFSTVTSADAVIDGLGEVTGLPIKLTTKADDITIDGQFTDKGTDHQAEIEGTDTLGVKTSVANDTITATVGTLQTGDRIVDPSTTDHDTLEARMEASLGTTANKGPDGNIGGGDDVLDPTDGPTITNIEDITLRDNQQVDVYNVANISGTENLNIDSKGNTFFNSADDVASLEIREADGTKIKNVVAIDNTTALYLTEASNGLNVILKDDVTNLDMDAQDGSPDHKVSVELKGAQITLGLADDNDDLDSTTNDGGSFGEMTLIGADKASTVTLAADTSLHNVTDQVASAGDNTAPTADIDDSADTTVIFGAINHGIDVVGTETETSTVSNAGLADKLILDGDQDITLVGTVAQFDEAVIEELDEATSDDMNSVITLTADVDLASTDLTAAEVDRVVVSALHGKIATGNEVSEIVVDVDTVVEVKAIEENDSLVVTGENATDSLDIDINVGNAGAARGNLVLGGDAHISTADMIEGSTSGGGSENGTSTTDAKEDTEANAATATITVTSNSNLNVLDVSQLTSKGFTLQGDKDLTVGILVMGGDDTDQSASIMNATEYTGDLQADLVIDADTGYDDGEDVNGDLGGSNRILLGSGNDVLGNVGIVDDAANGDDIAMGAGDDVVKIGSIDRATGKHGDDAVSAEIWGQEGRDTYIFQSEADTTNGVDSYVQIEDFNAGSNGDQIDFDIYRDRDGEGATNPDVESRIDIYDNMKIMADTDTNMATNEKLVSGDVVLISTADIDTFDNASALGLFGNAATTDQVFDDNDYHSGANAAWFEWIFIVGETSGNDGVKIFSVTMDGTADTAADETAITGYTATLIGQLQNLDEDINITTLTNDNFDFL